MSTNPDEQNNADAASEVVEAAAVTSDESAANVESPAPSETSSASKPTKKILIGSQRDEADPQMGTKAIRDATLHPEGIATAIQGVESAPHQAAESTQGSGDVADASISDGSALSVADAELEAALEDLQMDSLMGEQQPVSELEVDERIRALVTRVHNDNVFFSLKGRFEGIASMRQFKEPPKEGAMLDVVVNGFKEDEGLYEVSIPGSSVNVADWSDLVEGATIEAKVTGSNTGGLELNVNNIRGFMPASQIDVVRVENFGDYVNKKIQCIVTEVNESRKRLVLSRRAILERENQEKKQELLGSLAVGQTLDGVVTKLMDFGAFVDIGGAEGLVHVSKMSWDRVSHPSEVLEPGQQVQVKVEKINAGDGKISLSYRDTLENPWAKIDQKYPMGAVVDGTVSRIAQFGAFVKLEPGVEGLVHISELAHHRVIAVKNVVKQGDAVQVKVLAVDPQAQKIGLSLKATQAKPEKAENKKDAEEADTPIRESAVKKRSEPLKGGRDKGSGGEQFGLNW